MQPNWWALSQGDEQTEATSQPPVTAPPAPPVAAIPPASPKQNGHIAAPAESLQEVRVPGEWVLVDTGGPKRPPPRYEHAVATIGSSMYMVGGNCSAFLPCFALVCMSETCNRCLVWMRTCQPAHYGGWCTVLWHFFPEGPRSASSTKQGNDAVSSLRIEMHPGC